MPQPPLPHLSHHPLSPSRIFTRKELPSHGTFDADVVVKMLCDVLDMTFSRRTRGPLREAAGRLALHTTHVLLGPQSDQGCGEHGLGLMPPELVEKLYGQRLQRFFAYKGEEVPVQLFSGLCERFPDLGWRLAGHMAEGFVRGANMYRKSVARDLLVILLHRPHTMVAPDGKLVPSRLPAIAGKIQEGMIAHMEAILSETPKKKDKAPVGVNVAHASALSSVH